MNDSDLLELAAKAAGKEWTWAGDRFLVLVNSDDRYFGPWNPLTDDGDALRLAVKLRMSLHIDNSMTDVVNPVGEDCTEAHLGDPYTATRRAIVRAAAEIGGEV